MTPTHDEVTVEQREHCALTTLRQAATIFAEQENMSFEEAFLRLCKSTVYTMLFDYATELWKEGPDYLLSLYQRTQKATARSTSATC